MKNILLCGAIASLLSLSFTPAQAENEKARPVNDFLESIGACVHVQHGQDASKMVDLLKYVGIRHVRDAADRNYDMSGLLLLHRETGVKVVMGPGSGARDADLPATLVMARQLHEAGALLAIEGPNEPNNFGGLTYQGENSNSVKSWMPVAKFQRDLYKAVKADAQLKKYPLYSATEMGAQPDNVGLQFLVIPKSAGTLMPAGTRYADVLNVHNYMYHDAMWPGGVHDNQIWNAADPTSECRIDGLYNNHGRTWGKKFAGYSNEQLMALPRVTTETGVRVGDCNGAVTEEVQANNYINIYLAQFKRGWSHTFIYEFLDDPDGSFGFYKIDYKTPRKAALYLHNLTTILADKGKATKGKVLSYSIIDQPETTHDLLLQKSDGSPVLIIWGERVQGSDSVKLQLKKGCKRITVYDPTVGTEPILTLENKDNVTLTISDHPLILFLK
ncbi:MAG: glycosyl hydrolase [Bacteroidales bacterium]|nr:glycosyl hydrolase [Bacteroidales bacterium]